MYENIIQYKSEYMLNTDGERQRYKVNDDGLFELKDGRLIHNENIDVSSSAVENKVIIKSTLLNVQRSQLIEDKDGEYYRNWRPRNRITRRYLE